MGGYGVIIFLNADGHIVGHSFSDGAWSYDELEACCEGLRAEIAEAAARTSLPAEPDETALDGLTVSIVQSALEAQKRSEGA